MRLRHDWSIFLLTLLAGLPAVLVALWHLWLPGDQSLKVACTLTCLILVCWVGLAALVRDRFLRPLQTMANLLTALREGDFSIRAHDIRQPDPIGDVMTEINALGVVLQEQRLGALEATTLLRTVMEEIDVAIFAFDSAGTLRLVNRAGQELLAQPADRILGRTADDVGLAECLDGDDTRVLDRTEFPGGSGRWGMRRTQFREGGRTHRLIVIADLSQALREEETQAWQRLVRVVGHELNNSLAPIKSIAGSLSTLVNRRPRPDDWEDDLRRGLDIIASRADGLARFMQAYSRLARLPQPVATACELHLMIHRVVGLELRLPVRVLGGPNPVIHCDGAQIEQVLINLLKNAVEASIETGGGVRIGWREREDFVEIVVEDDGPGVGQTRNLFVPFFTTKPAGSGIGLVLCRQIAENHGGSLHLANRADGARGCLATLRLPLAPARPQSVHVRS